MRSAASGRLRQARAPSLGVCCLARRGAARSSGRCSTMNPIPTFAAKRTTQSQMSPQDGRARPPRAAARPHTAGPARACATAARPIVIDRDERPARQALDRIEHSGRSTPSSSATSSAASSVNPPAKTESRGKRSARRAASSSWLQSRVARIVCWRSGRLRPPSVRRSSCSPGGRPPAPGSGSAGGPRPARWREAGPSSPWQTGDGRRHCRR